MDRFAAISLVIVWQLVAATLSVAAFAPGPKLMHTSASLPAHRALRGPLRFACGAPNRGSLILRMVADGKPADVDLEKSVESFEEMVKRVTGKEDYKFGDLSAGAGERIVTTIDSIQNGTMNAMDKVVTTTASPEYQFGDVTAELAKEVVAWGQKERRAFETLTGKEYEFGDVSKFVAASVMAKARERLGPDYQFGDLTKAAAASAVKAVQNYKFGDISKGVLNMFQQAGQKVAEGVKSAEGGMEAMAAARLELLEQEKVMISEVLNKGKGETAAAKDKQKLLVQEMSYLETLCDKAAGD